MPSYKIFYHTPQKILIRDLPDVMNIEHLCAVLAISKKTAYKLLQGNQIAALKVGRAYRIPKTSLVQYLTKSSRGAE